MINNNTIITKTIGECWINSIKAVMNHGNDHYDEDVKIKEILGLLVEIEHPLLDDKIINQFGDPNVINRTLDKFSKNVHMPDRPFTYGACIYDKNGIDQFEWLVNRLLSKRETKSATICLLTPGSQSANLPCLTTIDAKIRNNRLSLQFFFRSQNIFGRQYANLLALVKLQNDIAKRCSAEVGTLKGYVASAHIYDYDFEQANFICFDKKIHIEDKYYSNGPKSVRSNY
jgi:thymidylate synthase (methanogen type)